MHVFIIAVGSNGDVLPAVSVGAALACRAHHVTFIGPYPYAELARYNGLDFVPLSDEYHYYLALRQKAILATRYDALFVARHCLAWNVQIYDTLVRCAASDSLVFSIDRPHLWADFLAKMTHQIPVVRATVDLPVLRLGRDRFLPPSLVQRRLSEKLTLDWWAFIKARGISSNIGHLTRLIRRTRALVPRVALWPAWITGQQRYPGLDTYGFVPPPRLPVGEGTRSRRAEISEKFRVAFVVGTEGTLDGWTKRFSQVSERVCIALDCEGILLGGSQAAGESDTASLFSCGFVPLNEVLHGSSAIVHHGGIGTAAAAIHHAVPQVVVPRCFMQPTNAEWMRRLGVGTVLDSSEYTPVRVTEVLSRVFADARMRDRCVAAARAARRSTDIEGLLHFIEAQRSLAEGVKKGEAERRSCVSSAVGYSVSPRWS
jgi:UDP:flavonoid glycosyltransferase YjiC (YdhE family)